MPAPGGDRGTKPDKVEVFCSLCGDKKRRMVDILSGTAVLGWLGGRPGGFGSTCSPVFIFRDGHWPLGYNAALDAENN